MQLLDAILNVTFPFVVAFFVLYEFFELFQYVLF